MAALTRFSSFPSLRPFFLPFARNSIATNYCSRRLGLASVRCIHRPVGLASVPALKEQNINYPPVTPRWPPGFWGELEEKRAWELYEQGLEFEDVTSIWDKLNKLAEEEHFFFTIHPFVKDSLPRVLSYQQYLTKTHLLSNCLPTVYDSIDVESDLQILKSVISQDLVVERARIVAKYAEMKMDPMLDIQQEQIDAEMSESLINCLLKTVVNHLSGTCEHLFWAQQDQRPTHEAFWAVAGLREECDDLSEDGFMKLQYTHQPTAAIRVEHPLPVFTPLDDEICHHPDVATDFHYTPEVYEGNGSKHQGRINPGFLTKTPFNDPCPAEFGHLSVSCISSLNELRDNYSQQEISDLATGCGLISAFGSTLTQAHSQGFNWWNDLTYPITTQTVVFDGKNISFCAYQLNTLMLWKIGERGVPHNNVCWSIPETPLFEEITEDSVIGLNDDALRNLLKFLKLKPEERGLNLRPHLRETVKDVQTYINRVDEPLIERPHPPRLYSKSKKLALKLVSPVVVTRKEIDKTYKRAEEHWDAATGRFVPVPRKRKPNNRIRKSDS